MSQEVVLICDKCKSRGSDVRTIHVHTRRYMDAAGDSDTESVQIELCASCMAKALYAFLKENPSTATGLEWLGVWKNPVEA